MPGRELLPYSTAGQVFACKHGPIMGYRKNAGSRGIDILVTYLARKDVFELPLLGCQIHPSPHSFSAFPLPGWLQQAAIGNRVRHSDLRKTVQPQRAGVALAARRTVRAGIIAAVSETVIHPEFFSPLNDLRLGQIGQLPEGRIETQMLMTLNGCVHCQDGHCLEGADKFGTAIRITEVIERLDPNEDSRALSDLGKCQGIGEKNGVAG